MTAVLDLCALRGDGREALATGPAQAGAVRGAVVVLTRAALPDEGYRLADARLELTPDQARTLAHKLKLFATSAERQIEGAT